MLVVEDLNQAAEAEIIRSNSCRLKVEVEVEVTAVCLSWSVLIPHKHLISALLKTDYSDATVTWSDPEPADGSGSAAA